jgi:Rieske Fe-S protein
MKRAILASILVANLLAGGAVAQIPPTDRRMIPPRSIQLSAQQDYVIKENLKDMHIEQVPRTKEIWIGNKVASDIRLHEFPPLVVEKVPKVKTYKFFITENQIVLVNPQNEIADIIK